MIAVRRSASNTIVNLCVADAPASDVICDVTTNDRRPENPASHGPSIVPPSVQIDPPLPVAMEPPAPVMIEPPPAPVPLGSCNGLLLHPAAIATSDAKPQVSADCIAIACYRGALAARNFSISASRI
jgi:hypothetical protein